MKTTVQIVAVLVYLAIMAGLTLGAVYLSNELSLGRFALVGAAWCGGLLVIAHLVDRRRAARDRAFGPRGGREDQAPPRGR